MVKKRIPTKVKEVARGYVQRLKKQDSLPVSKVILFGSQAKGKTSKWSDIDLCIVSPKFKNGLSAREYLWSKRQDNEVRKGLEPVGFSPREFRAGSSIVNEIKKTGVLL